MAWHKCTFIFSQRANGWAETWYLNVSDATIAISRFEELIEFKKPMIGQATSIDALRVTLVDAPGVGYLKDLNYPTAGGLDYTDYASLSIVGEIYAGEDARRTFYWRGYPDNFVAYDTTTREVAPIDGIQEIFKRYVTALKDKGFHFKAMNKDVVHSTGYAIRDWSTSPTGFIQIDVDYPVPLFKPGDKVMIKEVKGATKPELQRVNRTHLVKAVSGSILTINTKVEDVTSLLVYDGGKAYRRALTYYLPSDASLVRVGRRKAGRAFFVPPGRRPAR
jgi:hypothetical protein